MPTDRSEGYDRIAAEFMAVRSDIGAAFVSAWAKANLAPSSTLVDIGCGSGIPIAGALIAAGFNIAGIDASPAMLAAFHANFPNAHCACETAQESIYFNRTFDAAIAVGLLFLLSPDDQRKTIERVALALTPSGRFLFSAPRQACQWPDLLTNRISISLGDEGYQALLEASGFRLLTCHFDDRGNTNYFDAQILPRTRP